MGSIGEAESLPYWQVNVPPSEREATCPEFLLNPNSKDLEILQTPDSQYHLLTWDELKAYIESNRLDVLQRKPSDLRRYIAFNHDIRKKFGSVMNFILQKKLGWEHPIEPSGAPPFENPEDWRVQWNDWPYGLDPKIVHLVVWTKFAFEEDASLGDLTPAGRKAIDDFVEKRFRSVLPREKVSDPALVGMRTVADGFADTVVSELDGFEKRTCCRALPFDAI
jgi:hypothetical protein